MTKKTFWAKVAFKVKIRPDSYAISQQTVQRPGGSRIDENFANDELEWSTKHRKAIILYGLLVKLEARE